MNVTLLFMALAAAIVGWWILVQRLTAKPWLEQGTLEEFYRDDRKPPAKVGLGIFLCVVTSFFGLFISAYFTRMAVPDWTPLPEPGLLWVNTVMLVFGSVAFQWAHVGAGRDRIAAVKAGLMAAGIFSVAFLGGQLWVWQQLIDMGYFMVSNPANSFFYLFTALHGLHLLGGLWVWGKTTVKAWQGKTVSSVSLSVELCTLYWHFLLLVWLILFALLLST